MKRWIAILGLIGWMGVLVGCNMPKGTTPTVGGADSIRTAAARTLDAISTGMISTRVTPIPQNTQFATQLHATLTPSTGPSATPTKAQTGTPAVACDQVTFIRDVSIPDGTLLFPDTTFTKTWELKNTGSCAWNSTYQFVFANEGDMLGGPVFKPVVTSGAIQPGESLKLSVDFKTPATKGDKKSYWMLRNPAGVDFGPGGKSFWVAVKVADGFQPQDNLCNAEWHTANAILACPGKAGDAKGTVLKIENPKFASGYLDNEPAIQLEPQQVTDGVIVGTFPPYRIDASAPILKAVIGCAYGSKACDTLVTLTAQAAGEAEKTIGEWNVTSTKEWAIVKMDLAASGLVGKSVVFRITVRANGSPNQDRVLILGPALKNK